MPQLARSALTRCLGAILLIGLTPACSGAAPGPLFFVVASDTQKPDNDPFQDFRRAVAQINELNPDFVVMPGDLANNGTVNQYEHFMNVARRLRVPTYFALGNHDVDPKNLDEYWANFCQYTGAKRWYTVDRNGHRFVVLDSVRVVDGKLHHEGALIPAQREWLLSEIAATPAATAIHLVAHHPFHAEPTEGIVEADKLLTDLANANLVSTWTGHRHYNRHTQSDGPVHHFITGSLSFALGPRKKEEGLGYRLVSMNEGVIATAWAKLDNGPPLVEIARQSFSGEVHTGSWGRRLDSVRVTSSLPLRFDLPPGGLAGGAVLYLRCVGSGATITRLPGGEDYHLAASDQWTNVLVPLAGLAEGNAKPPRILDLEVRPEEPGRLWVAKARLLASRGDWQVYSTRQREGSAALPRWPQRPKPVAARVLYPSDGATIEGSTPVIVRVSGRDQQALQFSLDGTPLPTTTPTLQGAPNVPAVYFVAQGLQSKSHGFKNALYVNGEIATLLPSDRNVEGPEPLAYPVEVVAEEAIREVVLTAGTKTDPSGANPPENNEDWVASSVVLYQGKRYLIDPQCPPPKAVTIGDNNPECSTKLVLRPSAEWSERDFHLQVFRLDPSELTAGKHTLEARPSEQTRAVPSEVTFVVERP